ncbi:MAG: hypothetical protein RXQ80_00200 [Sulfolobaceae archaeon]|jgi:hypothetical protein|nr:hypothetical protein [Candidatus Nanopusillus sp.]MDT7875462.1 hypothetical protein [Sulfolobaceae archaeon]
MSSNNIDELKKFLEDKINELKKELEYYEYLLSLLETEGYKGFVKGNKGTEEIIKNSKGEIIAQIFFTPPIIKIVFRSKIQPNRVYLNVINKLLENEKNADKIEYNLSFDKDELKEIIIENVQDEKLYNKIKAGLKPVIERLSY